MKKRILQVPLLIMAIAMPCTLIHLYAVSPKSKKPTEKEIWAKKYHIYKPRKKYETNAFRVIKAIAPECGIKEITTKRTLIFINEILTARDKVALMNCSYDIQKPLKYFFTEYSLHFENDSDNSMPMLLAWTLRHMIHSKYPDEKTKKKHRDELKAFLEEVFVEVKSSLEKKLKGEYTTNEKAINKQIRECKDLIYHKYKVLQSDPFFPAFKSSPISQKVALEYIQEEAKALNSYPSNRLDLKATGGVLGLSIEDKACMCITRFGNKLLSAIASVPIDRKCMAEKPDCLYPRISSARTKKYWPIAACISLGREYLEKMKTGNIAEIDKEYRQAAKDLKIDTSDYKNQASNSDDDPRQASGFNYVE